MNINILSKVLWGDLTFGGWVSCYFISWISIAYEFKQITLQWQLASDYIECSQNLIWFKKIVDKDSKKNPNVQDFKTSNKDDQHIIWINKIKKL